MPHQHWQTQPFINFNSDLKRLGLFEPRVCQVYYFRGLPLGQLANIYEYCCNTKKRLKTARWKCSSKKEQGITASVFNSVQVFYLLVLGVWSNLKYYRFWNPGERKCICYLESNLKLNGFYLIFFPHLETLMIISVVNTSSKLSQKTVSLVEVSRMACSFFWHNLSPVAVGPAYLCLL